MPLVNLHELKRLSLEAEEQEKKKRVAKEATEKEREKEEEKKRFEEIVSKIPSWAEAAAKKGERKLKIMDIRYDDYIRPPKQKHDKQKYNTCKSSWLKGVCRKVFEFCKKEGLNPRIVFWKDEVRSGFMIEIYW